ncbi:MAG: hydrogenase maturation nickel metallochaperone HypA [Balneolales bacterium]
MHELSIAIRIVDIAVQEATDAGAQAVTDLDVEVGSLSGVVIEALDFAMQEAVRNTILEHARVNIIKIMARARCKQCHNEFETDDWFDLCPHCQSVDLEILQGRKLQVKSLKVI